MKSLRAASSTLENNDIGTCTTIRFVWFCSDIFFPLLLWFHHGTVFSPPGHIVGGIWFGPHLPILALCLAVL
jgi:hypothetical protein